MTARYGVGRPDVASLVDLLIVNLLAEQEGRTPPGGVVEPSGLVTRTPLDAAELSPGEPEAISVVAGEVAVVGAGGQAVWAHHAAVLARALKQLATDVAHLRQRAEHLYREASALGVPAEFVLGDGSGMARWLVQNPAAQSRAEGLVREAIRIRLEWVGVHDLFVASVDDLRSVWAIADW